MKALRTSNIQSTHKDSNLFKRSCASIDVLFAVQLVPWALIKYRNRKPCAVQKTQKMGMKQSYLRACWLMSPRRQAHLHAQGPSALTVMPEIIVPEI